MHLINPFNIVPVLICMRYDNATGENFMSKKKKKKLPSGFEEFGKMGGY